MMHRNALRKHRIVEIAKACRSIAPGSHKGGTNTPYEQPAARANVLMHSGLWPTDIKLNHS